MPFIAPISPPSNPQLCQILTICCRRGSPTRPLKFGHREAAYEQIVAVAEATNLPRGNLQYFSASETKDKAMHFASHKPLSGLMYDEGPKGGLPDLLAISLAQMSFRQNSTSYTDDQFMEPLAAIVLGDHDQVKHIEYSRDENDNLTEDVFHCSLMDTSAQWTRCGHAPHNFYVMLIHTNAIYYNHIRICSYQML